MEAPDKIYLERSLSFPDKFHSHWYKEDVVGNGEEYIRKNALLEKIDEILSTKPDTNGIAVEIAAQAISDIRKVIDSM